MATIEIDGELWDDETGNYLGPKSSWIDGDIDSDDKALVFMRRHLELESAIAAKRMELQVIKDQAERLLRDEQKRLEWWRSRYGEQIAIFARTKLTKTKTWHSPFGSVSFRATPAKVTVLDEDKAIAWAEASCPAAVKVKRSLLVSQVPDSIKDQMLDHPHDAEQIGFGVVPANETFTIKTGVSE